MSREKTRARRLTVAALFYPLCRFDRSPREAAPYIRLKGYYLKKWGFSPGDKVEISAMTEGLLVIRKIRTAEAKAPAAVLNIPNDTERHEFTQ